MIKNLRDLGVGNIVETREGDYYAVLSDRGGRTALYNPRATWARIDDTKDMTFAVGKTTKEVVRVYGFTQTLPELDQISEAMKFLFDTRPNTKELFKLWEVEPEAVTEIKKEIAELKKVRDEANVKLAQCTYKLSRI